jgi:hypothetical protein
MYILTAAEITSGLAGKFSSDDPACCVPEQSAFDGIQTTIRTRVEEALGIETLDRVDCRDSFNLPGTYTMTHSMRLANAFLTTATPVIKDADGEVVTDLALTVDRKYGIVTVALPGGTYFVEYTSGFEIVEETKVYKDLPDWVKSIALSTMMVWRRSMNLGAAPKDISHSALTHGMIRELHARIYNRYDRPRAEKVFYDIGQHRAAGTTGDWNEW